jgi:hypothetical protein
MRGHRVEGSQMNRTQKRRSERNEKGKMMEKIFAKQRIEEAKRKAHENNLHMLKHGDGLTNDQRHSENCISLEKKTDIAKRLYAEHGPTEACLNFIKNQLKLEFVVMQKVESDIPGKNKYFYITKEVQNAK